MTPKEKAKELFEKMRLTSHPILTPPSKDKMAKACALIAVEEILKGDHLIRTPLSYWQEVKQEIEKL
jgi:hypothetical protein